MGILNHTTRFTMKEIGKLINEKRKADTWPKGSIFERQIKEHQKKQKRGWCW